jgi:hypothetical protein
MIREWFSETLVSSLRVYGTGAKALIFINVAKQQTNSTEHSFPLEAQTVPQVVKKSLVFWETRRFITVFTTASHFSLTWITPNQSTTPHTISCKFLWILSSHLCQSFRSLIFPLGFPIKILYATLLSPHAPHTNHGWGDCTWIMKQVWIFIMTILLPKTLN